MSEPGEDRAREPTPSDERFSRAGASAAGLFVALPFVSMGGALLIAPCVALAGIVGAPWMRLHRAALSAGLPLLIAALFLVWVIASTFWSPKPGAQAAMDFAFFTVCALLFIAAAGSRRLPDRVLIRRAGIAGMALLALFVVAEGRFDFPIGRQLAPAEAAAPRMAAALAAPRMAAALAAPPLAAGAPKAAPEKARGANASVFQPDLARAALIVLTCFWGAMVVLLRSGLRGQLAAALLFAATAWISSRYGGGINVAALSMGMAAAASALIWPRATVSTLAQLIAGLIVIAPLVLPVVTDLTAQALDQLAAVPPEPGQKAKLGPFAFLEPPFGWLQRAETWRFAAEQIQQKIPLGWGFGGSGQFDQTYVLYTPSYSFTLPYIPGHPLSAPIQIWLETGAVGAVLAAAALASFGRRAGAAVADDRIAAAAAAGLLVAAAFIMTVSGWTWSLWWWGAVAIGAALIRAAKRPI